ncbi:cytidine deaminase [Candidatus Fermentibacteria bacterium]|nr:cytidine deaminase [Candidatus Fermentibacteria bacterium]
MSDRLMKAAKDRIENSYSPYSGVRVSAALEDDFGKVYTGVNIENSSYGLTICAERSALAAAVTDGARRFTNLLIYSPDAKPVPCGACLQTLSELCPAELIVSIVGPDGTVEEHTLHELLPMRFSTED